MTPTEALGQFAGARRQAAAIGRLLRSAVLMPPACAAVMFSVIAMHQRPPAASVASGCLTAAAAMLLVNLIAWAARDGAAFGREARLSAFVALAAILVGWYAAQQSVRDRVFDYIVARQQRELEESAHQLAAEISAFVAGREHDSPPPPEESTWEQDQERWAAFDADVALQYSTRFAARVRTTRGLLTFRNLRDRDLDAVYLRPWNLIQMQVVADRLRELADRLQRALDAADY